MDDRRLGLVFRALRRRLGWRQSDVAKRAHVRQQEVSNLERGHFDHVRFGTLRRLAGAVDARASLDLQWRGGLADRLVDERYAQVVERAASVISAFGWQVRPEVSFAQGAEHGSIDLLAWHETMRTVLLVEMKTELTSIEETVRRPDIKVRVGSTVAQELLGWEPLNIGTVLVLAGRFHCSAKSRSAPDDVRRSFSADGPALAFVAPRACRGIRRGLVSVRSSDGG